MNKESAIFIMNTKYLKDKRSCLVLAVMCFTMYAFVYMTKDMFSSAMASVVENGIMTKSQTGAINAMFWLVYTPCQILGGFAADRYSPSLLICIGIVGNAVANIIIFFNQSYLVIMIAWMFAAAIQFGVWPSTFKIISTQVDKKYRSGALFLLMFSTNLGIVFSKLVATFVPHWKINFLVSFIVLMILLVAWCLVYSPLKKQMVLSDEAAVSEEKADINTSRQSGHSWKSIIATGLICIVAVGFFYNVVSKAISMLTPTMLMESYESLSASGATLLSIVMIVISTMGIFLFKFIQRRITKNEIKALSIMLILCIPFLAVSCFIGSIHYICVLISLSVSLLLLSIAASFYNCIPMRYVYNGKSGTVAGMLNAAAAFANVLASFVFAYMAEFLPWKFIIIAWGALVLIAVALCLSVFRKWKNFIG